MLRILVTICLGSVFVGSSTNVVRGQAAAIHQEVAAKAETLAKTLEEYSDLLASIKDETTGKAAFPKIQALKKRMETIPQGKSPSESESEAIKAQFSPRIEEALERLSYETARISSDKALASIAEELGIPQGLPAPSPRVSRKKNDKIVIDPVPVKVRSLEHDDDDSKGWDLDFSPDGKWLVTLARFEAVRIWDVKTGKLSKSHEVQTHQVSFLRDSKTLAVRVNGVELIDLESGRVLHELTRKTKENPVLSNNLSQLADGNIVCTGFNGISIWKMPGAELKSFWPVENLGFASCIATSSDGSRLATNEGLLWDLTIGKPVGPERKLVGWGGHRAVAFSPDSKTVAYIDRSHLILCDASDGKQRHKIAFPEFAMLQTVAYAPNGKVLAVGGSGILQFCDPEDGTLIQKIPVPSKAVSSLAFSPNNQQFAAWTGKTVDIWDCSGVAKLETARK